MTVNDEKNENLWKDGIVSVACCTKSFGMGINKTNVHFVYLVDMPESLEDFYQEIGRAGRDGDPAVALYLSSIDDKNFHVQNIGGLQCSEERQFKLENLYKIATFFTQTNDCRHKLVLQHFSENAASSEELCDICTGKDKKYSGNYLAQAKQIMKCFTSMSKIHSKITSQLLLLTLFGSNSQDIKLKGLDQAEYFGVCKKIQCPIKRERKLFVQRLLLQMLCKGYLTEVFHKKQFKAADKGSVQYMTYIEHGDIDGFYQLDQLYLP